MKNPSLILSRTTVLFHAKQAFVLLSEKHKFTYGCAMMTHFHSCAESQPGHTVTLSLNVSEQVELEVCFGSDHPLVVKTRMLLQVADNLYTETAIQVSGEAYQEVVSMSNISRALQEVEVEDAIEGQRIDLVKNNKKQKSKPITFLPQQCEILNYCHSAPPLCLHY